MKSFMEFLLESNDENVVEATFSPADFSVKKLHDRYLEKLLNRIITKKSVLAERIVNAKNATITGIEVNGKIESVDKYADKKYVELSVENTMPFQQFLDKLPKNGNSIDNSKITSADIDEFNKLLSDNLPKIQYTIRRPGKPDNVKVVNATTNTLWKGMFTEIGGAGDLKSGQIAKKAEAATAYCFNVFVGNTKVTEAESDQSEDKINKKLADEGFDDNYIESSKLQAKKIISTLPSPSKMEAAHVDGNDIDTIDQNIRKIAKIFHSKEEIAEVLAGIVDKSITKQLYGNEKDDWNKADIVIANKKLDIVKAADEWKKTNGFDTVESFNEFLNTLITSQHILPLSLKAIDKAKNKTINDVRFIPDGSLSTEENPSTLVKDVKIQLAKMVKDPAKSIYATNLSLKATCERHVPIEVVFRNKGHSRSLLITAIDKSSKSQVGSAVNKLKAGLELGDSFLDKVQLKSLDEFEKKVKDLADETFEIPSELKTQIKNLKDENLKNTWIDRTAYKAFIAVLEGYSNKFANGKKVDIIKFFRYIYDLAAGKDSKSIWWLVK